VISLLLAFYTCFTRAAAWNIYSTNSNVQHLKASERQICIPTYYVSIHKHFLTITHPCSFFSTQSVSSSLSLSLFCFQSVFVWIFFPVICCRAALFPPVTMEMRSTCKYLSTLRGLCDRRCKLHPLVGLDTHAHTDAHSDVHTNAHKRLCART